MTGNLIFSWLGQLVTTGGAAAIVAYGLFKFLGKGWIENQLAKDLEVAKSEIFLMAARKMKLHDREYVVFPEVWAKLNKAYASLGNAVISYRKIPDLNHMSDTELQTWMGRTDLSDDEKGYLADEKDKYSAYNRILDSRSLLQANLDYIDFYTHLQANRIFLSLDIKEKLDQIDSLLRDVWAAKKMDGGGHKLDDGKSYLSDAYEKYSKQAKPIITEIETLVQGKLFPVSQD